MDPLPSPVPPLPVPGPSRRTVVAAAWAAPVVTVVAAVPSYAASGGVPAAVAITSPASPTFDAFRTSASGQLLAVRVTDALGNPVVGRPVTLSITRPTSTGDWDATFAGGLTTTVATTDAQGVAAATYGWTAKPVTAARLVLSATVTATGLSASTTGRYRVFTSLPVSVNGAFGFGAVVGGSGLATWGSGSGLNLGQGSATTSPVPALVTTGAPSALGSDPVVEHSVFGNSLSGFAVALTAGGVVATWGSNSQGQLGQGNATTSASTGTPTAIDRSNLGGTAVTQVVAGFNCGALVAGGRVFTWGGNNSGLAVLGNNAATFAVRPIQVSTGELPAPATAPVTRVAVATHALAIAGGRLFSWGPAGGRLGTGSTTTGASTPVRVRTTADDAGSALPGGATVTVIAAGGQGSYVLADSRVYACGAGNYLGNGTATTTQVPLMQAVPYFDGRGVAAISAGQQHVLALDGDGAVHAWGIQSGGRLGDRVSDSTVRTSPTLATAFERFVDGTRVRAVAVLAGVFTSHVLYADGVVLAAGGSPSGGPFLGDGSPANTVTGTGPAVVVSNASINP